MISRTYQLLNSLIIQLVIIIPFTIVNAQSTQIDLIKKSPNYYWGEAKSINEREAEDNALSRLTQMISVNVQSNMERNIIETNEDIKETVENIIKTYSTASLKNVKTISSRSANKYTVFRYISKIDVNEIFNERKELVYDMFEQGTEYERKNNFGYAIKLYYYSMILIKSIPDVNIIYEGENLTTVIPLRINKILSNTKFALLSDNKISDSERILKFKITVFDKPASYFEFNFWDGSKSIDVRAKDGVGVVKLFGSSVNFEKLDLSIKYQYYECRDEIDEVANLWSLVKKPSFKNGHQIELSEGKEETIVVTDDLSKNAIISNFAVGNYKINIADSNNCDVLNKIGEEALVLLELLSAKDISSIKKMYSYDGFLVDKIISILSFNNISIVEKMVNAKVNKTFYGWELRKIKVLNEYNTLRKQTTEYLILDFDQSGRLVDLSFGITEGLYDTFVNQSKYGKDWDKRQIIIKFVERYRTAFLTRDMSVLDSIFSDEAIIIVGRVLRKKKLKDSYKYAQISDAQPTFEQIRYTKHEYLSRQKKIFDSRKDLFLGFSTFNINRKNKQEGVYGVSMRQHYNSTGYSDEGYLFLLIDFNETLPQIYVRSWQPKEWDNQSLIQLSNFNINK
jgi:hypothetical protein